MEEQPRPLNTSTKVKDIETQCIISVQLFLFLKFRSSFYIHCPNCESIKIETNNFPVFKIGQKCYQTNQVCTYVQTAHLQASCTQMEVIYQASCSFLLRLSVLAFPYVPHSHQPQHPQCSDIMVLQVPQKTGLTQPPHPAWGGQCAVRAPPPAIVFTLHVPFPSLLWDPH